MTTAYQNASDDDKNAWWNALSDGVFGMNFIGNCFTNAHNIPDTYDLNVVTTVLDEQKVFYSPDNPPPYPVVTLPVMISAFADGEPADQTTFKNDIVDVPTVLNTLGQLSVPQIWAWITTALANCHWVFSTEVNFVFGSGTNSLTVNYTAPCTFVLSGTIYLNHDTTGGGTVQFIQQVIPYEQCDSNSREDAPLNLTIAVPYDGTTNPGLGTMYSLFMQKLDQLLRCCPPCDYSGPFKSDTIVGFGQVNFSAPLFFIDKIIFAVAAVGDPKVVEFGQPDLARYGKFSWIDEGQQRPLQWINFDGQVIYAPSANCTGFSYILDPGVSLTYHAIGRSANVIHWGVENPST